jgi:hypothetical protein
VPRDAPSATRSDSSRARRLPCISSKVRDVGERDEQQQSDRGPQQQAGTIGPAVPCVPRAAWRATTGRLPPRALPRGFCRATASSSADARSAGTPGIRRAMTLKSRARRLRSSEASVRVRHPQVRGARHRRRNVNDARDRPRRRVHQHRAADALPDARRTSGATGAR